MTDQPIKRALISVSDKAGVVDFANFLARMGVELLSTGGTAARLEEAGLRVKEVSDQTGFPEIMDGRVKTLHPRIHGGLLGRRGNPADQEAMADYGIAPIDLLVVNLYPFEETVASGGSHDDCVENIDIGGPAMIRAAAKNHADVAVVTSPDDYDAVLDAMQDHDGALPLDLRQRLAAAAFARTAAYDAAIAAWFADQQGEVTPLRLAVSGRRAQTLRYGENPHQDAALYLTADARPGVARAVQLQGKALSYNNINDTDAAYELVAEFDPELDGPTVAIVKHANPCGAAVDDSGIEAWYKALASDPVSAFGGIVAANVAIDAAMAQAMTELFLEVIIAPEIEPEARRILSAKANLRVLSAGDLPDPTRRGLLIKSIAGGFLAQTRDIGRVVPEGLEVVSERAPNAEEMRDLIFAFRVAKHVKSNAIVYAKAGQTVGIGAGQMSRVDSARIAALKSRDIAEREGEGKPRTQGSVVASDAFFPFADGLISAVEAGATAVIQPGGSMRDSEVIEAANKAGIAMVFTGIRHFRH